MNSKVCLLLASLAFQANASPVVPVEPPRDLNAEDWSLLNFRRSCAEDQSQCEYSFLISEYADRTPEYCSFTVDAAKSRPAFQTGFSLAKCPDTTEYSINGGWSDLGFITLTVINEKRSLVSFFAYTDEVLTTGIEAAPQQSKVYLHPIPVKREVEKKDLNPSLAEAPEWRLKDVVRYVVDSGTSSETLVISFQIEGGDAPSEYCFLQVPIVNKRGAPSKSFYDRKCQQGGSGWIVSWGHNETTDEAVMTLVNSNRHKHAFFGFNNVSTHVLLGVNGPSPTKSLP